MVKANNIKRYIYANEQKQTLFSPRLVTARPRRKNLDLGATKMGRKGWEREAKGVVASVVNRRICKETAREPVFREILEYFSINETGCFVKILCPTTAPYTFAVQTAFLLIPAWNQTDKNSVERTFSPLERRESCIIQ